MKRCKVGFVALLWMLTSPRLSHAQAPPVIANVTVSPSRTTAVIAWVTNGPGDSQVDYGLTSGYGWISGLDSTHATIHAVSLFGLVEGTTYHFRVRSRDAAGNEAVSADFTFQTFKSIPQTLGWHLLPGTKLVNVCPPDTPEYEFTFYCRNVVGAWSGGIADTARNRMMVWGGGHNDYYGNELYALDLNYLRLERLNNPSPINSPAPYAPNCVTALADGKPNSRHTYSGLAYVAHSDRMYSFGGSLACSSGEQKDDTWLLDLASLQWTPMDPTAGVQASSEYYFNMLAHYDPNTQMVYLHNRKGRLYSYKLETNTYAELQNFAGQALDVNAVIDPKRKLFLFIGGGDLTAYNIQPGSDYAQQNWKPLATGCNGLINAAVPGLAYDPVQDRIIGWAGGDSVYVFDVDTKTCTSLSYTGGPGAANNHGTYGRFRYFPSLAVFALVNLATQDTFALRLTPPPTGDGEAPSVLVIEPASGATLTGPTRLAATAADNAGIVGVQFRLNGVAFGAEVMVPPYEMTFDPAAYANGTYHLMAVARDSSGNQAISRPISITISNPDLIPPAITGPTVTGVTNIGATLAWSTDEASDSQVEYGTTTAYGSSTPVDSTLVTSHSVTLSGLQASTLYHFRVKSKDAAGNEATSGDFTFTTAAEADTTAPVISAVTSTAITPSGATLTWSTDEASDSQVEYGATTAYGSNTPVDSTLVTSHSVTLSGLQASTLYHFRVKSKDATSNLGTSPNMTFTTSAEPDTIAPTVAVTAPVSGTTISGTIIISAEASDNLSVVGVKFVLDGNNLGAEDTAAPFQISWNTATAPNGIHVLTAVARDAAGNQTTSSPVTVTITNTETPFIVTLTPVADAYVRSDTPTKNFGTSSELRVRLGTISKPTTIRSYLKFTLNGLNGTVTAAKLRLWVRDGGTNRGSTYSVANNWLETAITWNNAPMPLILYASGGLAPLGTWVEIALPAEIFAAGQGDYSFVIAGGDANRVMYDSRQGASPPQLVLTITP